VTDLDARERDGHANAGFRRLFGGGLTFGLGFPLTGERRGTPDPTEEVRLAERAEALGFDGLWARDVPTYWPRFGDAGGAFDPWALLSHVAARTEEVALGTSSVVLPLRHPIHLAKSAATVDRLSDGRVVLGVASGDRDPEYAAFGVDPEKRGEMVRERIAAMRACWREDFPEIDGEWGELGGDLDVLPKPTTETLPVLPTGKRDSRPSGSLSTATAGCSTTSRTRRSGATSRSGASSRARNRSPSPSASSSPTIRPPSLNPPSRLPRRRRLVPGVLPAARRVRGRSRRRRPARRRPGDGDGDVRGRGERAALSLHPVSRPRASVGPSREVYTR